MTDLVSEARLVSSLARKRSVDAEDARLAAWMLQERTTACPPPRHVTSEVGHVSRVTCYNGNVFAVGHVEEQLPAPDPCSEVRTPPSPRQILSHGC